MDHFGEKLKAFRKSMGLTQQEVCDLLAGLGMPTPKQAVSRWETEINRPRLDQFMALCRIYGIRDAYAAFMEHTEGASFSRLNKEGLAKLADYRQLLLDSGRFEAGRLGRLFPVPRMLPLYDLPTSAGPGVFMDGNSFEMIEIPEDVPQEADFALRVSGDSMEPTLSDGTLIYVHRQEELESGDIGVFFLNGNAYVKEYSRTESGAFLLSHNSGKYAPIALSGNDDVRVYGKVVYRAQADR